MKIFEFLRKNRIYAAMAVFILAVNLLVLADRIAEDRQDKANAAAQAKSGVQTAPEDKSPVEQHKLSKVFPGDEEVRARQEKLTRMASDNPKLYMMLGLLNMLVMYIIFAGVVIDVFIVIMLFKKRPPVLVNLSPEPNKWGFGDVIRVVLIFLASGYAFVILQAFAVKSLPILGNENFSMVFNTAVMNIVGISVIVYFVRGKYGQSVAAMGLTLKGAARNLYYAIGGYIALIPVLILIMVATYFVTRFFKYQPPVQPIVQVFMEEKQTGILLMSTLFAAVFGPVAEEIFFRGFMYPAIRKGLGRFWGMMITSAVFAFLHAHIVGFLPIMALGLLLVYLYEKTGSLVPSMAVHIAHNVSMVTLVFAVRGIGV
jgi:membrane protease YdiL (CAAX protease family)